MPKYCEIRALYDKETITVYQAYNKYIAQAAAKHSKFVAPFSFNRMTWIKPSFLWMMERSNWGNKSNQEHTLAIKISRNGFEEALKNSVLSHPEKDVYKNVELWNERKKNANVTVQWDPERNIRGGKLDYRSIQIGLGRNIIKQYNDEWIISIEDISPTVQKMHNLIIKGEYEKAKRFLPEERIYTLPQDIAEIVGISK